jgi:hypothetical protein
VSPSPNAWIAQTCEVQPPATPRHPATSERLGARTWKFSKARPRTSHLCPAVAQSHQLPGVTSGRYSLSSTTSKKQKHILRDCLWSSQRRTRQHASISLDPSVPPSCVYSLSQRHLQRPPTPSCCARPSNLRVSSSACIHSPRNCPNSSSCRIGSSQGFFLSPRKSRGDLVKSVSGVNAFAPHNTASKHTGLKPNSSPIILSLVMAPSPIASTQTASFEIAVPAALPGVPPISRKDIKIHWDGSKTARQLVGDTFRNRVEGIDHDQCDAGDEDAFFVADLGEVYRQHIRWKMNLKRVKPFYGTHFLWVSLG